jgi:hypothetical protein
LGELVIQVIQVQSKVVKSKVRVPLRILLLRDYDIFHQWLGILKLLSVLVVFVKGNSSAVPVSFDPISRHFRGIRHYSFDLASI